MNFAAWAVVITMEKAEGKGLEISDYAGLGRKYPVLAAIMTVSMLSFTGIPPTLGFIGKFYLFRSVVDGGFICLAIIGVLTSLVSAYYYLRIVIYMYMQDGEPTVHRDNWVYLTAVSDWNWDNHPGNLLSTAAELGIPGCDIGILDIKTPSGFHTPEGVFI